MHTIFILLGANLGNPLSQLDKAKKMLHDMLGEITSSSSIYESEAWGVENQPIFYNQVLKINTTEHEIMCLDICQDIENKLGRIRKEKWGARVIDIDILYYDNEIFDSERLKIPHPLINLRKFVLVPLNELAPEYIHPTLQKTNSELLIHCEDILNVTKLNNNELQNNKSRNN